MFMAEFGAIRPDAEPVASGSGTTSKVSTCGRSGDRRDVDLEPLFRELLDGSIGLGGSYRIVEHLLQVGLPLTKSHADAGAKKASGDGRSDQRMIVELRLAQ